MFPTVNISPEMDEKLEKMSKEAHEPKDALLAKAIFLMDVALDSKKHGNKLAVVNDDKEVVSNIQGV